MLLSRRLLRRQPLQGCRCRVSGITNLYKLCVRRDIDAERRAKDLIGLANGETRFLIFHSIRRYFRFVDLKRAGIENELLHVASQLLDGQNGSSLDRLLLEYDFEVQIQMANLDEVRICIGMNV